MSESRPRVYVYRGAVPLWLVLAVLAPLGLVFLTSLVLAVAVVGAGAALAALVLPRLWHRRGADPSNTIELDQSQFHRIDTRPPHENR
jgi:hypothetical protein